MIQVTANLGVDYTFDGVVGFCAVGKTTGPRQTKTLQRDFAKTQDECVDVGLAEMVFKLI